MLILFAVTSCSQSEKTCADTEDAVLHPVNPNGDSELALLMRDMFDDVERMKRQIAEGKPVSSSIDHEKILTAHATQPEKAASAEYKAFAVQYLSIIEALKDAGPDKAESLYSSLVTGCMSCHQAMCPGPIVKIRKLKYDPE